MNSSRLFEDEDSESMNNESINNIKVDTIDKSKARQKGK